MAPDSSTPRSPKRGRHPGVVEGVRENTALGRAGTPPGRRSRGGVPVLAAVVLMTGEVLTSTAGAHLKRYPNIHQHLTKLMGQ